MNPASLVSFDLGALRSFLANLLRAEVVLTVNIVLGLVTGEIVLSLGIVDKLFAPLVPTLARWGIHRKIAGALMLALGSSRSAAALISTSYVNGEIDREEATFGTLALAFPGYLRRWVGTAAMATGIAGRAGLVYAAILIVRSGVRFLWVVTLLVLHGRGKRKEDSPFLPADDGADAPKSDAKTRRKRLLKTMKRSLPWAWGFFALTYALMPWVERLFTDHVAKWGLASFLPAEGWAVAASALAHVTAALSSAGGALAAEKMTVAQAVLALVVGNMVGAITRTMRQNVGYWMGIFPGELMPGLVKWHVRTQLSLELLTVLFVWLATL